MPLYEYQCESCDHRFEKIVKYSDPPIETCPKCGKGPVRKLLSSPAIQFKGSGWYITDYAKKSSSEGGQSGKSKDKSADAGVKSDAKSDSTSSSSASETSAAKPTKTE